MVRRAQKKERNMTDSVMNDDLLRLNGSKLTPVTSLDYDAKTLVFLDIELPAPSSKDSKHIAVSR